MTTPARPLTLLRPHNLPHRHQLAVDLIQPPAQVHRALPQRAQGVAGAALDHHRAQHPGRSLLFICAAFCYCAVTGHAVDIGHRNANGSE